MLVKPQAGGADDVSLAGAYRRWSRGREHHDHRQPHRRVHRDPVVDGGVSAAEWSKLLPGIWFYDPGFMSTAACESAITYLDGDAGILRYRGYPIEQLAEHSTYLEVAYLLLNGELPDHRASSRSGSEEITYHTFIHENVRKRFLEGFHYDAHPMGMLVSAVAALSTFYLDAKDIFDPESRNKQIIRLIAKMPTLAAAAHRFSVGHALRLPRQLPRLHRQLPLHDVEGRRAPVRGRPGAGPGARRAVHPPRRPRAELLDHRHAGGRLARTPTPTRPPPPPPPPSTGPVTAAPTRRSSAC